MKTKTNTILTMIAILAAVGIIGVITPTPASGEAGGPRQIPGERLGCHFANPAGNVNTNPHCLGLSRARSLSCGR
jgi:hypothetical protein